MTTQKGPSLIKKDLVTTIKTYCQKQSKENDD